MKELSFHNQYYEVYQQINSSIYKQIKNRNGEINTRFLNSTEVLEKLNIYPNVALVDSKGRILCSNYQTSTKELKKEEESDYWKTMIKEGW